MLKVGELWQNIAALKRPEETNTNCSQLPRFHTKATEHSGIDTAKNKFLAKLYKLEDNIPPSLSDDHLSFLSMEKVPQFGISEAS